MIQKDVILDILRQVNDPELEINIVDYGKNRHLVKRSIYNFIFHKYNNIPPKV